MLRRSSRTWFAVASAGRSSELILISSSTNLTFLARSSVPSSASAAAIAIGQNAGTLASVSSSEVSDCFCDMWNLPGCEHWQRRAAVAVDEPQPHRLPDAQRGGVADDVGQHRRALGQRHICDHVRRLAARYGAERVDHALALRLAPVEFVRGAVRTHRARIPVRPAAGAAM